MLLAKAFNFRKHLLKHTKRGMEGKDLSYGRAVVCLLLRTKCEPRTKSKVVQALWQASHHHHLLAKDQLTAITNTCALNLETWTDLENQIITEQFPCVSLSSQTSAVLFCSFISKLECNYFGKAHSTLFPITWFPHWIKSQEKSF